MSSLSFDFQGASGELLSGRIEKPQGTARGWAIFAHCFTCGKDSLAAVRVSRALARYGVGVLRFDFVGLGSSGGNFGSAGFSTDVNDLVAAALALSNAGMAPSLLVGHSLGGAAALSAAGAIKTVKAVATIGTPSDVAHVQHLLQPDVVHEIETEGGSMVSFGGKTFHLSRRFLDSLRRESLMSRVKILGLPLLILHAPSDNIVGIDNAQALFDAASHPKNFIAIEGADHMLSSRGESEYVAAVISAWAEPYLRTPNI
ncbi:TPA: alpha/beta fold hydrolase [Stenotrophomonas maltophilia]|uniref:alpha/beta hydrolase family protein n=1 Tax=Stenotrophomonas TaxID=40323 RepID=UPI000D170675|nr:MULTISPECIES: alpha/beta fold hydrolase [unclassified Stenotrophomonas]PTA72744.1 osmotically inducible protein OsmC [Stenotrophomonas sp. Nf1]PTA82431.1 osmotically inducible protein OsmC [Stenotrophomonas sp. Nf4]